MADVNPWDLPLDAQLAAAEASTAARDAVLPRARAVRYDPAAKLLEVTFRNGASIAVPIALVHEVAEAPVERISDVCTSAAGDAIEWPSLDVHLDVTGLILDVFGSEGWIREMARRVGSKTSEKKRKASAENGKKGGRPPSRPPSPPTVADAAAQQYPYRRGV